jgi:hypothetical protein
MNARIKLTDLVIDEGTSRQISDSQLSLVIKNMKRPKIKTIQTKVSFPYTFEFSTPKGRMVIHNLIRKKGEYCSVSVADRLIQLESPQNTNWHKVIKKWKDDIIKGVRDKPSRKLRVQFAMVKIKDITIDDDIQRDMDPNWVASIANPKTFEVDYMSTIQCIYDPKKKKYISINAQHTVVLEAAFTHHGLWKEKKFNIDPMELEVPVAFIKTSNRAKARMAFRIYNGKGQKKIEPYVDHKNLVFAYRVDGSDDEEAVNAAKIQTINEEELFEPIATTDSKNKGQPWAINCIAEMQSHYKKSDRWRFVLNTHYRYYPNIQLDIMECDLYGFMYDKFCVDLGYDVYSEKFREEFLDPVQAIIQEFFQTPHNFGSDSKHTQIRFQAKRFNRAINSSDNKVEDEGSFIYLLKLYQYFGGKHELPTIVYNLNEAPAGDLLDHVDKETLLEAMKNHGKS